MCVCMYISNLLAVLCFHCFTGFSPVVVSGHCFLVAVHRLLIAEISLVLKHKLKGARASIVVGPYSFKYCFSFTLLCKHGFVFLRVLAAASYFIILVFNHLSFH